MIRARTKLAAPGGASVGQAADGLVVSWNGVGAAGYEVYRAESKDGSYKRLASIKSVSYKDKTAKKGKTYYYKVRGYLKMNKRQYFGGYSAITSGVINDGVPIVKVTPTDYSVKLSRQSKTSPVMKYTGQPVQTEAIRDWASIQRALHGKMTN